MTKFEFRLPHPEWDVNGFFEGRGLMVVTRVRTGPASDKLWSVVVEGDMTKVKRDEVVAALNASGARGLLKHEAEPTHTGSAKEIKGKRESWQYAEPSQI